MLTNKAITKLSRLIGDAWMLNDKFGKELSPPIVQVTVVKKI